jgi:hypothetical protein
MVDVIAVGTATDKFAVEDLNCNRMSRKMDRETFIKMIKDKFILHIYYPSTYLFGNGRWWWGCGNGRLRLIVTLGYGCT